MLAVLITNIISSILLLKFYRSLTVILKLFDKPNYRKIHKKPISQFGGFIFFINIFIFILLNILDIINFDFNYSSRLVFVGFLSYLLIFLLGYLDDRFDINPYLKTILLVILIITTVSADQSIQIYRLIFSFDSKVYLGSLSILFTVFCIFIFLNAFNMFDGINCQASLFIFSIILFLFLKNVNLYLLVPIIVSNFFFLFYNLKNRIYLGNNGSYSISYLLSLFIIFEYNNSKTNIYADDIVLLLFIPIIDLLRLFMLRIFYGRSPFNPDNNHIHHLITKKLSYFNSVVTIAALNIIPSIINSYFHKTIYILVIVFFIYLYVIYFFNGFKLKISSKS
jgi:UDP-GlcNAc:undecaprenyl-phosphate/decaprenyl-phosphate GlcNAc-1-phosphate transferase